MAIWFYAILGHTYNTQHNKTLATSIYRTHKHGPILTVGVTITYAQTMLLTLWCTGQEQSHPHQNSLEQKNNYGRWKYPVSALDRMDHKNLKQPTPTTPSVITTTTNQKGT